MRSHRRLTSIAALLATAVATPALAAAPAAKRPVRPTISNADRAAWTWAVQNVVSRHDYLHALERNQEEVDQDWVSPTGQFAATATFCLVEGCLYGIKDISEAYGQGAGTKGTKMALQRLAAIDPRVKDTSEFEGAGNSLYQHTNTTPIIEIAGDGKTAKGVWYTPGIDITPVIQDGKVHMRGGTSWQKLAVDFVRENGEWKIWHTLVAMDTNIAMSQEQLAPMTANMGDVSSPEAPRPMPQGGGTPPGPFHKPLYVYPRYSPERSNKVWPELPRPYYSFAETTSYCNCEQEVPAVLTRR